MHLFAPNEDCLLRACKEIGVTEYQFQQDLENIREWLAQQPHLPVINESLLVENMLLRCKGSVQAAKKALDYHLSMRAAVPAFFADRDPLNDELQCVLRHWTNVTLSERTCEGYRVKMYVLANKESLEQYSMSSVVKLWLMECDLGLKEDVSLGEVHIHDVRNLSVAHMRHITPLLLQQGYQCGLNGYKARLKGIHLLNAPPHVDALVSLIKTVVPKKLAARIHVHPDLESLHKHVDKEMLPKEYGGDQKPMLELASSWAQKFMSYRDWFLDQEVAGKVDEKKRPPESVYSSSDFFGIEGTFRKLQVD